MNLTEAARATRKYFVTDSGEIALTVDVIRRDRAEAQSACDRLNLAAVLEAIREPSDSSLAYVAPEEDAAKAHWINMVDALIAEVKAQK